jgi:transcriptional regulator GlxA family with amidase domain
MRNIVYFFVFDGFADWEAALALCEIRRPGDYQVRTVAAERRPVRSMGGLTVQPDLALADLDEARAILMILPGGAAWERGEHAALTRTLRRLHAQGVALGALCGGVLALARAGLLEARAHTANYAGYLETFAPGYGGAAHCDPSALAVADGGVITAASVGSVEFAREVIRLLNLYDARDTEAWYRLFKQAELPPWLAPPLEAVAG